MHQASGIQIMKWLVLMGVLGVILFSGCFLNRREARINKSADIRKNWTSNICPKHNISLKTTKVGATIGGRNNTYEDESSRYYYKPPFEEGEYPNADFKMFYPSCASLPFTEVVIYYCTECKTIKDSLESNK